MPGNDIFGQLEGHRQRVEQQRENSARLAKAYVTTETTGWGEIIKTDLLDFGTAFVAEPYFTRQSVLRGDSSAPQGQLVEGRFPRVECGVWRWEHDENGHWTGAYVYFVVETVGFQTSVGVIPDDPDPNYTIAHKFIFEAVAYKRFPLDGLDY